MRISQIPIVSTSARIPVSAQMSARLKAMNALSPPARSGFGTAMSFHAAERLLPRMPAARIPAAGATSSDGIWAIRIIPAKSAKERKSQAIERW